jgi:hypothetical protein
MYEDSDARTLAALERTYAGDFWDVIEETGREPVAICMRYPGLDVAIAALHTAGYAPIRFGVEMARTDLAHDLKTCMYLGERGGHRVVLVRRRRS